MNLFGDFFPWTSRDVPLDLQGPSTTDFNSLDLCNAWRSDRSIGTSITRSGTMRWMHGAIPGSNTAGCWLGVCFDWVSHPEGLWYLQPPKNKAPKCEVQPSTWMQFGHATVQGISTRACSRKKNLKIQTGPIRDLALVWQGICWRKTMKIVKVCVVFSGPKKCLNKLPIT